MRRGFIFTLDALLALLLAMMFITGVVTITTNAPEVYTSSLQNQNKEIAQGMLETFRITSLSQLVPPDVIEEWIEDGTLNLTFVTPQMPPLQIVAIYWAINSTYPNAVPSYQERVEKIMEYLLENLLKGYKYQLIIENYTFGNSYENASDVGMATTMISGYMLNATPRGYVARIHLVGVTSAEEKLVGIMGVLAGARYFQNSSKRSNSLEVKFNVDIPSDSNITKGTLSIFTKQGNQLNVHINNNDLGSLSEGQHDITDYLCSGSNGFEFNISPSTDEDEIGFGGGSWIYVKYTTSSPPVEDPGLIHLYHVESEGTGIYYLLPVFAPGNITGLEISLNVSGVHEVRVYYSNGTGFNLIYENTTDPSGDAVFIDNSTLVNALLNYTTLQDLSKKSFNIVILLDAYYDSNDGIIKYAGQDYNHDWNNTRILHSTNSYVRVYYVSPVLINRYYLPTSRVYSLSPDRDESSYMEFSYYLPENSTPWYVDVWTAISFDAFDGSPSGTTTVEENGQTFLTFPLDPNLIRLAYSKNVAPDIVMQTGQENSFRIESDNSNYKFEPANSRAIVRYFLNAYVPYGDIFTHYSQNNACGYNLTYWYNITGEPQVGMIMAGNCGPDEEPLPLNASSLDPENYALDDAIFRLFVQLGARSDYTSLPGTCDNPIRVKLRGLSIKSVGVRNVPISMAPIQITLRVWRGP